MPTKIILVTGPPRSGTTMLTGYLSRFPALPCLPECSALTDIARERARSEREQHPVAFKAFYGSAARADRLYRALVTDILEELAGDAGQDRYLVLKDPHLLFYLDTLRDLVAWPMRTVCTVRDPKDAVILLMRVREREGAPATVREAIDFLLPFFHAAAEAAERRDPLNPIHFVRCENFASREPGTLAALQRFVGYVPDADGHEGVTRATGPWHAELHQGPVAGDRLEPYHDSLSPDEVAGVETAFAPVMLPLVARCATVPGDPPGTSTPA